MSKSILVLCLVLVLVAGSVVAGDIEENLTYQGDKARIMVGTFKSKASDCDYGMAAAIGEMLSTALVNTDKFVVLASHEEVGELAEEIEFAQSEYAEAGQGPDKGLMESADLLVTGAITSFEPNASGGGGMLGGLKKKAFGSVGVSSNKAKIAMELKLIDIRTRRILKSKTIKAESKQWSADMTGGGWTEDISMDGALGVYSNEPMEEAIRAVLAKAVERIAKEVPKEYYRYSGQGQYKTEYREGQASSGGATTPASGSEQTQAEATAQTATPVPAPAPVAEDMTLYTKYDFVPGNKVIYYDDLKGEEEGEFPYRWKLDRGVFEIARMIGEYWILCTDNGSIRPKLPIGPLPEKYTVELEFWSSGPDKTLPYYYIHWTDADGRIIGEFCAYGQKATFLSIKGKNLAGKEMPEKWSRGLHTMRIMATTRSIKCYVDNVRVANVPKVEGFEPAGFQVRARTYTGDNPWLLKSFRFAEGGGSMREQLDENGKIITHGILFDPDQYVIKGESFKTLKDIGRLLEDEPDLRLSIEGYTDSDGSEAHNSELSHNRSKAVVDYLIQKYGVAADRLESKGWGESKPIDTNDTTEGKANNRRVELVKL
ncbi:MAG: OmpA family protein [candidate division Zixibacteria bacterium]|nr:OmpA family protein [candidate division Zixibacteria bacterium]